MKTPLADNYFARYSRVVFRARKRLASMRPTAYADYLEALRDTHAARTALAKEFPDLYWALLDEERGKEQTS